MPSDLTSKIKSPVTEPPIHTTDKNSANAPHRKNSLLSAEDDVFDISEAFKNGNNIGTVVTDRRKPKRSIGTVLSSAFSEWVGTHKSHIKAIDLFQEKPEPQITPAETRIGVIKEAAEQTHSGPSDDHKVVIERLRTLSSDTSKLSKKPFIIKKKGEVVIPAWKTANVVTSQKDKDTANTKSIRRNEKQSETHRVSSTPRTIKLPTQTPPIPELQKQPLYKPPTNTQTIQQTPKKHATLPLPKPIKDTPAKKTHWSFFNKKNADTESGRTTLLANTPSHLPILNPQKITRRQITKPVVPITHAKPDAPKTSITNAVLIPSTKHAVPPATHTTHVPSAREHTSLLQSIPKKSSPPTVTPTTKQHSKIKPLPIANLVPTPSQPKITPPAIPPQKKSKPASIPKTTQREQTKKQAVTPSVLEQIAKSRGIHTEQEPVVVPFNTNQLLLFIVVALMVLGSIGTAVFFFMTKNTDSEIVSMTIPTFIQTDADIAIPITDRDSFLALLTTETSNISERVTQLYPVIQSDKTKDGAMLPANANQIFEALVTHAPDSFIRSLDAQIMIGGIVTTNTHPFVIMKSSSYDVAFSGMIAWEPFISEDLSPFFGTPVTSSFNPNSRTANSPTNAQFVDIQIENRSARILYDGLGNVRIIYSFIDKNTIVLTTSTESLTLLIDLLQ